MFWKTLAVLYLFYLIYQFLMWFYLVANAVDPAMLTSPFYILGLVLSAIGVYGIIIYAFAMKVSNRKIWRITLFLVVVTLILSFLLPQIAKIVDLGFIAPGFKLDSNLARVAFRGLILVPLVYSLYMLSNGKTQKDGILYFKVK